MVSARTFWTVWGIGFAIWAAALVIASPWDLDISIAVANPDAAFGRLVATGGEWPAWAVVLGCVIVLIAGRKQASPLRPLWIPALGIIILAITHPLAITQGFKFLWGRIRFRDLGVDFIGYTPFYIPAGPGAGLSFPSGHVAMACVVSPIVFFLARLRGFRWALIALIPVLLYGLPVAWGRMLAGAHYLSDCLFSIGLSFLLAAILVRHLFNYQNH
jgi:membrane-associated phospholipid phosphatase